MADKENVLSPEELDALSEDMNDDSIDLAKGLTSQVSAIKHDLINEENSKGINTNAINPINDRILLDFKQRLSRAIRVPVNGSSDAVKVQTFGDYIGGLKSRQAINIVRLRPLHGESLLVIDSGLIGECFGNFFGGESIVEESEDGQRAFRNTELSINTILTKAMFGALKDAWGPIHALTCELVGFTDDPKKTKTMKHDELVLVSRFELFVSQTMRTVEIVYPYYALKSIRSSFLRPPSESSKDDLAKRWSENLEVAVMDAELELTVSLTQIRTTLREFESLRQDDIIYFSKPHFAKVNIENIPVFEGHVGTQGSNMAVQVANCLVSSK